MGACVSKSENGPILQKSIISQFVPEIEWKAFEEAWNIEVYQLSKHITIKPKDLMYVVISGEVQVMLQKNTQTNVHSSITHRIANSATAVQTFHTGDVIHMFTNSIRTSDGYMVSKDIQLALVPKSTDGGSVSIAILTEASLKTFLERERVDKSSITGLRWFCNLNVSSLLNDEQITFGLDPSQLEILGPLMKLSLARDGDALQYEHLPPIPSNFLQKDPSMRRQNTSYFSVRKGGPPRVPLKSTHILLGGRCLSLHEDVSFDEYKSRMAVRRQSGDFSTRKNPYAPEIDISKSPTAASQLATGGASVRYILDRFQPFRSSKVVSSTTQNHLEALGEVLEPGSVFGLENFFLGGDKCLENILACHDSVLGLIPNEAFRVIKDIDSHFYSNLYANFNLYLLSFIEDIPLFRDLTTDDLIMLSSLVTHKTVEARDVIYRQGEPSENLYIIIQGSVKEKTVYLNDNDDRDRLLLSSKITGKNNSGIGRSVEQNNTQSLPSSYKNGEENSALLSGSQDDEIIFDFGQTIGEVSVVTDSAYGATATVKERTSLIVINKRAFRTIFEQDRSKLAEMKIRVLGEDVELEYLLCHPKGYGLFVDFLEKEHASENIQFWYAADRFDDMYKRIWKEYQQIEADSGNSTNNTPGSFVRRSSSSATERDGIGLVGPNSGSSYRVHSVGSLRKGRKPSQVGSIVNQWKALDNNIKELHDVCKVIIDKFVLDGSPLQVNIPGKMRLETERLYKEWSSVPSLTRNNSTTSKVVKTPVNIQNKDNNKDKDNLLSFDTIISPTLTDTESNGSNHTSKNSSQNSSQKDMKEKNLATELISDSMKIIPAIVTAIVPAVTDNKVVPDGLETSTTTKVELKKEISIIPSLASTFDPNAFLKVKDIFKRPKKEVYDLLKKDTYVRLKLTNEFQEFLTSITIVNTNSGGSNGNSSTRTTNVRLSRRKAAVNASS